MGWPGASADWIRRLSRLQVVSLAASTVFELANLVCGKRVYEVRVISEKGGKVSGSAAVAVDSKRFKGEHFDALIVCGGSYAPN
jgi:hypothetical protein